MILKQVYPPLAAIYWCSDNIHRGSKMASADKATFTVWGKSVAAAGTWTHDVWPLELVMFDHWGLATWTHDVWNTSCPLSPRAILALWLEIVLL